MIPVILLLLAAAKYSYQALVINPVEIDQEYLLLQAWQILKQHKLTLIGASTGIGKIYIGPLYNYVVAAVMFATDLHPSTVNVLSAVWASLTPVAIYLAAKKIFSRSVGIVAGFLAATSPNFLHLVAVPPLVIPFALTTLLIVYCLAQLPRQPKAIWPAALLTGLSFHLHFTSLFLIPLWAIWLIVVKFRPTWRQMLGIALIWLLFISPLIAFDLRHDWRNLHNLQDFLAGKSRPTATTSPISRSLSLGVATAGALFTNEAQLDLFLGGLIFSLWIIRLSFGRRRLDWLLTLWVVIPFLISSGYVGLLLPYYYVFNQPAIFIMTGLILTPMLKFPAAKLTALVLAAAYLILVWRWTLRDYTGFSLNHKMAALEFIKQQAGDKPFNLSLTVEHARNGGLEFLLLYYGLSTEIKPDRPTYTVVIPSNWHRIKSDYRFGDVGVVLPQTL
jgi:4-amino-4-deoxy-L-arabinose transferase-like glycosyltransferase